MRKTVKAFFMLMILIGSLLLLTACSEEGVPLPKTEDVELVTVGKVKNVGQRYSMVQDVKTGCLYIDKEDGITPYYDEKGMVKGCKRAGQTVQP